MCTFCLDKFKKACQTCLGIIKAFDSVWLSEFLVKVHISGIHVKTGSRLIKRILVSNVQHLLEEFQQNGL